MSLSSRFSEISAGKQGPSSAWRVKPKLTITSALCRRCRQVVEDGYEFFAKRQLVTLFSAPNYCGEFDNAGALMSVDESLMCSFQILKVRDACTGRKMASADEAPLNPN